MEAMVTAFLRLIPSKKIDMFGEDSLMSSSLPYYLLPVVVGYGILTVWDNAWSLLFITYALLPALDQIFSHDLKNPSEEQRRNLLKNDFKFKLCLYVTIAIDWYFFFKALDYFKNFEFTAWGTFNLVPLLFIFSNFNALGFNLSHELMHKHGIYKVVATANMAKNLYMHFTHQHVLGHHRRVATPEDPASAQQGIDLYSFVWRSYIGSYKSVYKMQKQANKSFFSNYAVLSILGAVSFTFFVYAFYGSQATLMFLAEALFSIFYLEATNYIEHYGLQRKKLPNGEYEKVTIRHSWNAPHRFTNYLLFKLERHSDHHENATKPYQTLLSLEQSPHLPYGYTAMILIAFFPKTWFEIMDPLVNEYKKYAVGTIETELTQKSLDLTRRFTIKISIFIILMWTLGAFKNL